MGTTLTGLTPATTYDALIKVGDNGPITASLKVLSDGLGTNLPMEASTTAINFTGTLTQAGTTLQPTLISGTNIKTINGTSVLGSGNIAVVTSPSGVAGAIQFSNGSAFASDAANLFWDDTNNRLGVGTNAPTSPVSISNTGGNILDWIRVSGASGSIAVTNYRSGAGQGTVFNINEFSFRNTSAENYIVSELNRLGLGTNNDALTARMTIKGSGSTSATTSLLVQNSAGSDILRTLDDRSLQVYSTNSQIQLGFSASWGESVISQNVSGRALSFGSEGIANGGTVFNFYGDGGAGTIQVKKIGTNSYSLIDLYGRVSLGTTANPWRDINGNKIYCGVSSINASAILQADSTTQGFLPPRMTTTQKNNITTPAAGLVVYDSTTNKLCCYDGSTWNDLF